MFQKISCFVLGFMISSASFGSADASLYEIASHGQPSVVQSVLVGSVVGLGVRWSLQFYQNKISSSKLRKNCYVDGRAKA